MKYRAVFTVPAEVVVTVEADDEDHAADAAWEIGQRLCSTHHAWTNGREHAALSIDLDGIGADTVTEVTS